VIFGRGVVGASLRPRVRGWGRVVKNEKGVHGVELIRGGEATSRKGLTS